MDPWSHFSMLHRRGRIECRRRSNGSRPNGRRFGQNSVRVSQRERDCRDRDIIAGDLGAKEIDQCHAEIRNADRVAGIADGGSRVALFSRDSLQARRRYGATMLMPQRLLISS